MWLRCFLLIIINFRLITVQFIKLDLRNKLALAGENEVSVVAFDEDLSVVEIGGDYTLELPVWNESCGERIWKFVNSDLRLEFAKFVDYSKLVGALEMDYMVIKNAIMAINTIGVL